MRFVGKWGVSNPRAFVVSDRNEVEREGTEQRRAGGAAGRDRHHGQRRDRERRPTSTTRSSPGKKGQRVLIVVRVWPRHRWPRQPAGRGLRRHGPQARPRTATIATTTRSPMSILPADGDYFVRLVAVRLPGRRAGLLLPAHDHDRPVDRRRVPAGDRAGKADPGHALRPQPARQPAGRWLHGRWPAAGEARGHDHAADRRRGQAGASRPHRPRYRASGRLRVRLQGTERHVEPGADLPRPREARREEERRQQLAGRAEVDRRAVRGGRVHCSARRRGLVQLRREEGRPVLRSK